MFDRLADMQSHCNLRTSQAFFAAAMTEAPLCSTLTHGKRDCYWAPLSIALISLRTHKKLELLAHRMQHAGATENGIATVNMVRLLPRDVPHQVPHQRGMAGDWGLSPEAPRRSFISAGRAD